MLVEIAVFSSEALNLALVHGAQRAEYCHNYLNGGVSPSLSELANVPLQFRKLVMVMGRLREGDYSYNSHEQQALIAYASGVEQLGFAGFVCGSVTKSNMPDTYFLQALRSKVPTLQLTFHRAFDSMEDKLTAANQIADANGNRILTSGGSGPAINHLPALQQLQDALGDTIIILPGGGIRSMHLPLFEAAGFKEVHSAAVDDEFKSISNPLPNVTELKQLLTAGGN